MCPQVLAVRSICFGNPVALLREDAGSRLAYSRVSYTCPQKEMESHDVQLKEGVCDLKHENVWVVMFVTHKNALARSPHSMLLIMLL